MFDPELYRDKSEVEAWKRRCPVTTYTALLRQRGVLDDARLATIEESVTREIDDAVAFAESGTWEPVQSLTQHVYSETRPSGTAP
jgi:TPP-dependent pyruvate/acetoin dehydrogenase alpha subunit